MPLEEYRKKRKFDSTPEPEGRAGAGDGRFVVQEHHARRLHWDLRLEIGGMLKSWAVPKGPTLDPNEKRLAVRTEDHPMEYADFEGDIPKGNYGAGTMIVWDHGTWSPEKDGAEEQLKKGELKFVLRGQKLRGSFALVRLKPGEGKQEEWLLLKHRDSYAEEGWELEAHGGSVLNEVRASPAGLEGAVAGELPEAVDVMLATAVNEPFSDAEWLFEIKWDGMRAVATVDGGRVGLRARSGRDVTKAFPELALLAERVQARQAVLDGEIVVLDADGNSNFERLQPRMHSARPSAALRRECPVDYYVFDLLYCDGHDLREVSLGERKRMLREILDPLPPVRFSDHVPERGTDLFKLVKERGGEGIVAKRLDCVYEAGRAESWLKIKAARQMDVVVGGYTAARGAGRKFGSILAGLYDGSKLQFIGGVGSGFSGKVQDELMARLESLETRRCPFAPVPATPEPATWTKLELVARVKYRELTSERRLRQPVYLGLREDAEPESCTLAGETPVERAATVHVTSAIPVLRDREEIERELSKGQRDEVILELEGKPVRVRNLNKVYFPAAGHTKRDLLAWYLRIAPRLLPFLENRPLVLHRYPNGVTGQPFYQKDAGLEKPDWMETVTVASDGRSKQIDYYLANDVAALLFLANLGCIEHNPWSSSLPELETPDYVFFDLDPVEGTPYSTVVTVAREIAKLLEEIGCEFFAKTSGASGMHLYLPLEKVYTYEQVRAFAEIVARVAAARLPEMTTLERSVDKRAAKTVYLDYSQNGYGRPLASVYSVRPREAASISAPVARGELRKTLKPERFTLRTMGARLEKKGDLWSGFWGARQRIEGGLAALAKSGGGMLGLGGI